MSDLKEFNGEQSRAYPKEEELYNRVLDLVYEYGGEMATASAIGVLELAKSQIVRNAESNGYELG